VDTTSSGNGSKVTIQTSNLTIDGQGSSSDTGIFSRTDGSEIGFFSGVDGNGGELDITVNSDLQILNDGKIDVSSNFSNGNGGKVTLQAANLTIDGRSDQFRNSTGIFSRSLLSLGDGSGGDLDITVNSTLQILNGGIINAGTSIFDSGGNGGNAKIEAVNLTIKGSGSGIFSTTDGSGGDGNGGNLDITANSTLHILDGGVIDVSTSTFGNGGNVKVKTGNLTIDGSRSGILSKSTGASESALGAGISGKGGELNITVESALHILNGGVIDVSSKPSSSGNGGKVTIHTHDLTVNGLGKGLQTGIFSVSGAKSVPPISGGNGGELSITVKSALHILNGGAIDVSTFSSGNGGSATISAKNLTIDGQGSDSFTGIASGAGSDSTGNGGVLSISATNLFIDGNDQELSTGIASSALAGSTGNAGSISLDVEGDIGLIGKASIVSNTAGSGNAGTISIDAEGSIERDNSTISSDTSGSGNAGSITVDGKNGIILMDLSFISTDSTTAEGGSAGAIEVKTEKDLHLNFSDFFSSSDGSNNSGIVTITAGGNVELNNSSTINTDVFGSGDAGTVKVNAGGNIKLDDSAIFSDTFGSGNAGSITINTNNLILDYNSLVTTASIIDRTATDENAVLNGDAGSITITVDDEIRLSNQSKIDVSSEISNAGSIKLDAGGDIEISSSAVSINSGQGVNEDGLQPGAEFILDNPEPSKTDMDVTNQTTIMQTCPSEDESVEKVTLESFLSEFESPVLQIESEGTIQISNDSSIDAQAGLLAGSVKLDAADEIIVSNSEISLEVDQRNMNLENVLESFRDESSGAIDVDSFTAKFPELFAELTLKAKNAILISDSVLTTNAGLTGGNSGIVAGDSVNGFGGSINLLVPRRFPTQISLANSKLEAQSRTIGGNIEIDPYFYIVNNSEINTSANPIDGFGGDYTINAAFLLQSLDSVVNLTGQQDGDFVSSAVDVDLGSELTSLEVGFLNLENFVQASCDLYYTKKRSSFIVIPAEVQSSDFGDYLPSMLPDYLDELLFTPSVLNTDALDDKNLPPLDDDCIDCI